MQCVRCHRPNNSGFLGCDTCDAALGDALYLIGRKIENPQNREGHILLQHVYQHLQMKWEECAALRPKA